MTIKTIHAYTEPGSSYPAYINISHDTSTSNAESGSWRQSKASVLVRSQGGDGRQIAQITLTLSELEQLADSIIKFIYEGEQT